MPESKRSATDGEDFATVDVINEARRPLLIARHRELVMEMEQSLSEQYISGQTEHRRLQQMIAELNSESEVARTNRTLKMLSEDEHYRDQTLQQALSEYLCLMREAGNIEIAALQMHAIGVYRAVCAALVASQGQSPSLAELRDLSTAAIGILLNPPPAEFGRLGVPQVHTRGFIDQTLREIKALLQGDRAGVTWQDEDSAVALAREDEVQVRNLPEAERAAAIGFLVADRIRSRFYRSVFIEYLSVDEFDATAADLPPTVLAWLQGMAETPHLYPFLQGQPAQQKSFRIARLTQKIVQVFEIYARVVRAQADPRYAATLAGGRTREQLMFLAKQHYPPIPFSPELSLAALLCPCRTFVEFVQTRVQDGDFVLPPDPKR